MDSLHLSLEQTNELVQIAESDDPRGELEEFLARYAYDEGTEEYLTYSEAEVRYTHRYATGLKENN